MPPPERYLRYLLLGAVLCGPGTIVLGAQTPPSAMVTPLPEAQRLEPGDLIQVSVFQAPELATEARLDSGGAITMPEAGRVPVAGETAAQAARTIAARLSVNYLRHPQVQVLVRQFASRPVTVLGAVQHPGVYSARTFPNLESILGAAGGLASSAGGRILITARDDATRSLAVDQLVRGGSTGAIPLNGGEVVRVVPAATVYIGGDVKKPGAYPLPSSGLTLAEALTLAGGAGRNNRLNRTRLVRSAPGGGNRSQILNAQRVLAGTAPDVRLQPFDLVYVPHDGPRALALRTLATAAGVAATTISGVIIFH